MSSTQHGSPLDLVTRLAAATNAHDLDALVDCFAADYVNETPAHPARGFTGRDQVRRNWQQIFAGVPDLRATVLRAAEAGNLAWSEWEMSGRRKDGAAHLMRGVIVFGVLDGRADWARFYLEQVVDDGHDVNAVVEVAVGSTP